ncbi:GDP-mannose 4,6-dehydratase [Hymenobacter tibetensis]|uniref:GDP-mannose 4,6-dehydratase n=1 Tax=Hymenobacter tibetensis TaxID=497967 RepID=A0ABY4D1K7_9BACT|nr:GDP-mannose 4,6-dehydratase [Hymenobacter tibetensis]UOG75942.1 GDP-mannose 4,6-dehydratase [Hymenobacter tibetensis]
MKRILITGFSGFVSEYLLDLLNDIADQYEVIGLSRSYNFESKIRKNLHVKLVKLDLNDKEHLREVLYLTRPDYIFHLASDSSVSYSWQKPIESFQNNTNIFLNLIESVRALNTECKILSIGSSEQYGIVDPESIPLTEEATLNPISPYAVARVSQELLSKVYNRGYGLDIIMTRSFNHIGPGQKENFVVSSFAKQIVAYKAGLIPNIKVGNLDIVRDFLDVRDVVKAYMLLMQNGIGGQVYNICSGNGYSLKQILHMMMSIAGIEVEYSIDKELIRPSDNPIIIGSNKKIKDELGWYPSYSIDASLRDILTYWEQRLK